MQKLARNIITNSWSAVFLAIVAVVTAISGFAAAETLMMDSTSVLAWGALITSAGLHWGVLGLMIADTKNWKEAEKTTA